VTVHGLSFAATIPGRTEIRKAPWTMLTKSRRDLASRSKGNHEMTEDRNRLIALRIAQAGLRIFPCKVASRRPCINDWAAAASSDPAQIETWWKQWPGALPALPMKPNDLIAIDCDQNHTPGQNGTEAFEKLFSDLPPHPVINTPRGGQHHFFRQRENEKLGNRRGRLPAAIDVRGFQPDNDGGYVIAPGAILPKNYTYPDGQVLPEGAQYHLADGSPSFVNSFLNKEIPILPDCLADLLREPVYEKPQQPPQQQRAAPGYREQRYAEVALSNAAKEVATEGKGNRNNQLNNAALKIGHMIGAGWIDRAAVEVDLLNAAAASGLLKEEGNAATLKTIRSGIDAGMKEPHAPLPDRPHNGTPHSIQTTTPGTSEEFVPQKEEWPDPIGDEAHIGLAGEFVRIVGPHTESDLNAILIQYLTCFGSIIGRSGYFSVESTRHYGNIFGLIVGDTAKARKGTGAARVNAVVKLADGGWFDNCRGSGLSSGEGLVYRIRDEVVKLDDEGKPKVVDHGVSDKRLFVLEEEFSSSLSSMERSGNRLSALIRDAWDGRTLQNMTKNDPSKASNPHFSLVGHITREELRRKLTTTDAANGFANRFLFCLAKRSKELPFGGNLTETAIGQMAADLNPAIMFGRTAKQIAWDGDARQLWGETYSKLSAGHPGLFGSVTSRAEAQVVRLALLYALLDRKDAIGVPHMRAAMAVWKYCEDSARIIFGDRLGDRIADAILDALRENSDGMSRTGISTLLGRHESAKTIQTALGLLHRLGKARFVAAQAKGGGQTWFAT
jgi:hypothetical protein